MYPTCIFELAASAAEDGMRDVDNEMREISTNCRRVHGGFGLGPRGARPQFSARHPDFRGSM